MLKNALGHITCETTYVDYAIDVQKHLVGGFNPSKKMKVNGKDYPISYIMEKKHMFETTNQLYDVYCMVMITIGVFRAHKMLYQIGVCYFYQKNMVKSC